MEPTFNLKPDPRMVHFIGGFDDAGQPLPMSPEALTRATDAWPLTDQTLPGVAGLLKTSREILREIGDELGVSRDCVRLALLKRGVKLRAGLGARKR